MAGQDAERLLPPLDEKLCDWLNSPEQRELRRRARKLRLKVDLTTPKKQKMRKKGGGNKRKLAEQDIEHGKEIFRATLAKDSTWAKNKTASAARLMELEPKLKGVSVWTIQRWIVDPVLKEQRAK